MNFQSLDHEKDAAYVGTISTVPSLKTTENVTSPTPSELLGPALAKYLLPITSFNNVQAVAAPALLGLTTKAPYGRRAVGNVLVEAPTGSGKTLLLELAIISLFRDRLSGGAIGNEGKAIYISPIKALANEKFESLTAKFGKSLRVVMETGDGLSSNDPNQKPQSDSYRDPSHSMDAILAADIIISTPERWDCITRRWREGAMALRLISSVELLLIDEVHIVGEAVQLSQTLLSESHISVSSNQRGPVLESLVSRMKTVKLAIGSAKPVRIVAVSGTIPNLADFAEWLQVTEENCFRFREEDRPVPLTIKIIGYPRTDNPFLFERGLNFKLLPLMQQYSSDGPNTPLKPTLVFCASRKETVISATHLADEIMKIAQQQRHKFHLNASTTQNEDPLRSIAATIQRPDGTTMADASMSATDKHLQKCLLAGVAFHHAALCSSDRKLVEDLFKSQFVSVCCTTSTLAMGVNLPARLVIIKGTTFYRSDGPPGSSATKRVDISVSELQQMAGRAGRLGLDHKGVALVLTTNDRVPQYKLLDNDGPTSLKQIPALPPLESLLYLTLIDYINAEVALRTVQTVSMGLAWAKTTFWWVRLRQNPTYYLGHLASHIQSIETKYPASQKWLNELRRNLHDQPNSEPNHLFLEALVSYLILLLMQKLHDERLVRLQPLNNLSIPEANTDVCDEYDEEGNGAPHNLVSPFAVQTNDHDFALPLLSCEPTRLGTLTAKYYVSISTVETFNKALLFRMIQREIKFDSDNPVEIATEVDTNHTFPPGYRIPRRYLLQLLCTSTELVSDLRLRLGDKGVLNRLHKKQRFPLLKGDGVLALPPSAVEDTHIAPQTPIKVPTAQSANGIKDTWQKVFILTQLRLSDPSLSSLGEEFSLRNDTNRLWSAIPRLSKFLTSYCHFCCSVAATEGATYERLATSHGYLIEMAWCLQKSIDRGIWEFGANTEKVTMSPKLSVARCLHGGLYLKQLVGVGEALAKQLANQPMNLRNFSDVITFATPTVVDSKCMVNVAAHARRMELTSGRLPPTGSMIIEQCMSLPTFDEQLLRPAEGFGVKDSFPSSGTNAAIPWPSTPLEGITYHSAQAAALLEKHGKQLSTKQNEKVIALAGMYTLNLRKRLYSALPPSKHAEIPSGNSLVPSVLSHFHSLIVRNNWRVVICLRFSPFTLLLDHRVSARNAKGMDEPETFAIPFQFLLNLAEATPQPDVFNELPVTLYLFHEAILGADLRIDIDLPCTSQGLEAICITSSCNTANRKIGEKRPRQSKETDEGQSEDVNEDRVPVHFANFMKQKTELWGIQKDTVKPPTSSPADPHTIPHELINTSAKPRLVVLPLSPPPRSSAGAVKLGEDAVMNTFAPMSTIAYKPDVTGQRRTVACPIPELSQRCDPFSINSYRTVNTPRHSSVMGESQVTALGRTSTQTHRGAPRPPSLAAREVDIARAAVAQAAITAAQTLPRTTLLPNVDSYLGSFGMPVIPPRKISQANGPDVFCCNNDRLLFVNQTRAGMHSVSHFGNPYQQPSPGERSITLAEKRNTVVADKRNHIFYPTNNGLNGVRNWWE